MFFREPPCFPIGKKTPLNPPLSGGQKLSPLRRSPPKDGVCCRCPPDKGDTPEGGRGFFFRGAALLPYREETPLNPPLSGGQKLSPLRRSPPKDGVCCRCPPDKGEYPEGGRGLLFGEPPCFPIGKETPLNPPLSGGQKLSPLRRSPPKDGVCCRCPPDKGDTPEGGRGFAFRGAALLPYREGTPP